MDSATTRRASVRFRPVGSGPLIVAGVATLALVAGACGGNADPVAEIAADPAPSTTAAPAESTNGATDLEPVFLPTADGGQLDFNSLRGQDVLLWFWAPW